jgi:hypothetical protein
MTVEAFVNAIGFKTVCLPSPKKEIDGVYVGDLLSWVMGNAEQGNVWITIMSNITTVAVATLVDISCIILAENTMPDDGVLDVAMAKGVNVLSTSLSAYKVATQLSILLN